MGASEPIVSCWQHASAQLYIKGHLVCWTVGTPLHVTHNLDTSHGFNKSGARNKAGVHKRLRTPQLPAHTRHSHNIYHASTHIWKARRVELGMEERDEQQVGGNLRPTGEASKYASPPDQSASRKLEAA
jgi:hypothetical protein